MSTILQTNTILTTGSGLFTLLSEYSGETNPNIKFTFTLTVVTAGLVAIPYANVTLDGNVYQTDLNGQISVDLKRGDYIAVVDKTGYDQNQVPFTILD